MGLNEKKKQKEMQEMVFPKLISEIKQITGAEVTIDANWDQMCEHVDYMDGACRHLPRELIPALKEICSDEMGKDALKSSLNKIYVVQGSGPKITLVNGLLTLTTQWNGEYPTSSSIKTAIEGAL